MFVLMQRPNRTGNKQRSSSQTNDPLEYELGLQRIGGSTGFLLQREDDKVLSFGCL